MATGKTILVLGGGTGGIIAACRLRKKLPREHRVVLIERSADYLFEPSLLWLMTGLRQRKNISRPLAKLEKQGIELVRGNIERIDPESRTVKVNGTELAGDYLVIALGAELAPELVPGLAEAGHNLYALRGAERLRDTRLTLKAGRVVVLVSAMPFKCPAAPYEAAMLLEDDFRKRQLRDRIELALYTPEPGPMPVAGPEVSSRLKQIIEAKGIAYHPEHTVAQVEPAERRITFTNSVTTAFDLLVYIPPHRAPRVVVDSGLSGESGWIPVDRQTLATRFPNVYAIGDVTGIMLAMGKPLPKAGVLAHGEAELVVNNLVHVITGKGTPRQFDGYGECFIEIGDGKAGYGSGNFFSEPTPEIKLRPPSRIQHLGKVAFEKYWLFKWF